ncbi:hypothetical protein VULLAG_LOCUS13412 [Vulpes lagopus]
MVCFPRRHLATTFKKWQPATDWMAQMTQDTSQHCLSGSVRLLPGTGLLMMPDANQAGGSQTTNKSHFSVILVSSSREEKQPQMQVLDLPLHVLAGLLGCRARVGLRHGRTQPGQEPALKSARPTVDGWQDVGKEAEEAGD